MEKLSFSIPSNPSSSKHKKTLNPSHSSIDLANDDDNLRYYITEFSEDFPQIGKPKPVIPPIENEFQPGKTRNYSLNQPRVSDESIDIILSRKLKVDSLSDDEDLQQFEDVPVENFAAALMAGYGWEKGMGIGRNTKHDVKGVSISPGMVGRD